MKTVSIVVGIAGHVKTTPISAEQHLRDHMLKEHDANNCRDDLYRHYEQATSCS